MSVTVQCFDCREWFRFDVDRIGFVKWKEGTLIQRALPDLTDDQRELLISQTCGPCFDRMFVRGAETQDPDGWRGATDGD